MIGCQGDNIVTDIEQELERDVRFIEKAIAGIEIRQYEVFEMTCKSCRFELQREIKKIPGITEAYTYKRKNLLVIEIEKGAEVDDEHVMDIIQEVGLIPGKRLW